MTELEKLNRLRQILLYFEAIRSRTSLNGSIRTNSASLQLATSSGVSMYFEYAGDPSRNDHAILAPTHKHDGFESQQKYRRSKRLAERELRDFMHGMNVPELRDEFTSAIAKIAKKAAALKRDGSYVGSKDRREGVTAERLEERLGGNPLYELAKTDCAYDPDVMRDLTEEASEIVSELGLLDRFGYEPSEWRPVLPSYHQVNQRYHEAKKEQKAAPK